MNARLTPEFIQERLTYAASLSESDLHDMKVPELRALIRQLGVDNVTRDGEPVKVSVARKKELIEGIRAITSATKIAQAYEATELDADSIKEVAEAMKSTFSADEVPDMAKVATETLVSLSNAVSRLWDTEKQTWKPTSGIETVAASLTNYLVTRRNRKTGEPLSASTILNYKTMVLNAIREQLGRQKADPNRVWYFETLERYFEEFRNFVNAQLAELTKEKAQKETEAINARQVDIKEVDLSDLLTWANKTLEDVGATTHRTAWREVSIALALVTGRRMSEIHASAEFLKTGDYSLMFTGQLKTKGAAKEAYELEPSYEIPTLVKADLVLKGMEFLKRVGRKFETGDIDADTKLVNKRLNSAISELVNGERSIIKPLLRTGSDVKLTYHSLRQLYNLAAVKAFKPSNVKSFVYSGLILGHARQLGGKKDISTTTRYESDFALIDSSLTTI